MNVKDDKTGIPTLWPAVILPSITAEDRARRRINLDKFKILPLGEHVVTELAKIDLVMF